MSSKDLPGDRGISPALSNKITSSENNSSNQNSNTMVESDSSNSDGLGGRNERAQSVNNNNQRVKMVTKLLVDMNSGLMDDLNYNRNVDKGYEGEFGSDQSNLKKAQSDNDDPNIATDPRGNYLNLIPMKEQLPVPKVSKTSRLRAERVRIYLDYYYNILEAACRSGEDENGVERSNMHHGVEGVYNPLQIIRNRKLRKKYHDEVSSNRFLFYKAPVIAILQFSRIPNRKKYRWFVDVNEKYGDITFRSQHWSELKDPSGNLWFGAKKQHKFRPDGGKVKKIYTHTHLKGHLHHRRKHSTRSEVSNFSYNSTDDSLNEKPPSLKLEGNLSDDYLDERTASNDNSIGSAPPYNNNDASVNVLVQGPSDNEDNDDGDKLLGKGHLNKFEKIISRTGEKAKRWSRSKSPSKQLSETNISDVKMNKGSVTPLELDVSAGSSVSDTGRRGSVSGPVGKSVYDTYLTPADATDSKRPNMLDSIPIRTLKGHSPKKEPTIPEDITKTNSSTLKYDAEIDNIEHSNGIIDNDLHRRLTIETGEGNNKASSAPNSGANTKSFSTKEVSPAASSESTGLHDLPVDIQLEKYWQDTRYVISTISIMEHRRQTHDLIRQRAIRQRNKIKVDDDADKTMADTERIIEEYGEGLDKVLKIGNNWTSKLLNDYSIRVETLISASDRILSDINTTLTLKLKLFQENTDRFGSMRSMRSQRMTKSIYKMLEFFIVVVLWSIWLVVSILQEIKFTFGLVFKAVRWLLW